MDGVTEVSRVVASGTTGVVFKVRVTRVSEVFYSKLVTLGHRNVDS